MNRWLPIALLGVLLAGGVGYLVLRPRALQGDHGERAQPLAPATPTRAESTGELAAARQEYVECRTRLNFAELAKGRPLLRGKTKEELQRLTVEQFRSLIADCKQQLPAQ
jgi:hypothetical protein